MQKRRDRVKAWQAEKAKRLADELAKLGRSYFLTICHVGVYIVTSCKLGGKEDGSRSLESLLPPTSSGTDADASASHLSLSLPIIPATSSSSSGSAVGDSKGGNEGSSQPMWSLEDEEEDKGATNASLPAEDVSLGPLPSLLPPLASSAVVPDTISDVPREAKEASKDNEEEDEDFDPLEAYMDSLYSSGDVISQQRVIPQIVVPPGAPLLHDSARSITPSEGPDYSSDNEYFDGVNQYASSNIITMDQIMNASSKTGKGTKAVKMNSWESDTNPASPEEQDEVEDNEEREERERAEFLEAIRK